MSDYLQRLVVRHFSTVPRVLPNANTYFSAGAELAASEPAPEAGIAVDAASGGVEVAASGAFGKPVQPDPNIQPIAPAKVVHHAVLGTPGIASPVVSAGLHRGSPRGSTAISTPDVAPMSDHRHSHSSEFTSFPVPVPVPQATMPPGSQVGRSELPEVATINRSPTAVGQHPIFPGVTTETPTVVADPIIPAASVSFASTCSDPNYTMVDTDVAAPTIETEQVDSAAVALPLPTRSRRVVPERVPVQSPITPASPVAHMAPGRFTPSHTDLLYSGSKPAAVEFETDAGLEPTAANTAARMPDRGPSPPARHRIASILDLLRSDLKSAAVEIATATGIEPTTAKTAEHTSDRGPGPPAPHRIASITDNAQQEFLDQVATLAQRPLSARPIAPVAVVAVPTAPPPTATPSVTIAIGTIEVRAAALPHSPVMQPAPAVSSPRLSLDEYLRRRNGGGV